MQKNYARNDIFLPRTDVQEADIQEDNKQTDRQKTGGHTYNRENETYNFLKRNVQFSLFFHPIKAKAFNHHLSGN